MVRPLSIAFLLCTFCLTAFSQKLKTVEAEYTYYASQDITPEQARRTASKRAKIQALADAFGTMILKHNTTRMQNSYEGSKAKSKVDFFMSAETQVKGKWIETIREEFDDPKFEDGMMVITCRVKGKAREILTTEIGLEALVLRNGTTRDYEDDTFIDGNWCYLSFRSPAKGYLAIYLIDEFQQANRIAPEDGQDYFEVMADSTYLFYKDQPLIMTLEGGTVQNEFYFVFSPHPFGMEVSETAKHNTDLRQYEWEHRANFTLPSVLSVTRFQKWLGRLLSKDEKAQLVERQIIINPKK